MNESAAVVRVLRTRAELEALAAQWDALPQSRANPLLGHRWLAAGATLHKEGSLHVVTVSADARLAGVAPLARTRRLGVERLEFVGAAVHGEPGGLVARDPETLRHLCEALVAARRPLVLARIPADSGVEPALRAAARGLLVVAESAPCLRVAITGNWDDYLAGRSSQVRSGLRRKRAILEETGAVAWEALRPTAAELAPVLEEALDVEADGWKGAGGSSLRDNAALRGFIFELARRFAADGALRVCFLRSGARAVAMSILLEQDRCVWEIKIGYRESAGRASPGRLLLWEVLRDAFQRGLRGYEFLGSGDGQQPDWATASQPLQTLVYYPWTPAGLYALAMDGLARVLRRLRR